MPKINISLFIKKYTDYIISICISGILFWIVNFFGLGTTSDSLFYIEIAQEINSIHFFSVEGFKIKPPALPLIIAALGQHNMVWFNFFCFLVIQTFGVYWSRRITDNLLRYLFLSVLIFATPHLLIISFLWTEPFFLAVMLSAVYFLDEYYKTNRSKFMLAAIFFLMSLPFIRFAGIFLVIPVFGFLILFSKRKRFILIALVIFVLVLLTWVFLFKEGFDQRWIKFVRPFMLGKFNHIGYNISSYAKALSSWFFPYAIDGLFTRLLSLVCVLLVLWTSSRTYLKQKGSTILLSPILFVIYYILMISVFKVEYYSAERYLAIFYLLFFLNFFYQMDAFVSSGISKNSKRIVYVCIVLFATYSIVRSVKNVIFWNEVRNESISYLGSGLL